MTLCLDAAERNEFLAAVAGLVAEAGEQIRLVLTVRSDFEAQFRGGPLGALWEGARFPIRRLEQDDYREIITAPASTRAVFFESSELVEDLVNEVNQMPGGLPLLSFTLSEMYLHYVERCGDDRILTRADYDAVGVGGGIAATLAWTDCTRRELGGEARGRERLEHRTLRASDAADGVHRGRIMARRRVPRDELVYPSDEENRRVEAVLEKLTSARARGSLTGTPKGSPVVEASTRCVGERVGSAVAVRPVRNRNSWPCGGC